MIPPPPPLMCKKRSDAVASSPKPRTPSRSSGAYPLSSVTGSAAVASTSTASSTTSYSSLASLRDSLPEPAAIYPFAEIRSATNNFLAKRLSSSSSWRCALRGRDAVIFKRPFHGGASAAALLPSRLAALCRSHHSSLVRLLGASLSGGDAHIYLVYEYAPGGALNALLRSANNPSFTPLRRWTDRVQIADDLAQGLDYIHTQSGTVHSRVKSSAIIVADDGQRHRARICHFGAADLAGEIESSKGGRIEGTRGYMAPELLAGAGVSQASDVFAFGVVLLELLSGAEPVRYSFDKKSGAYERASVIEAARAAIGGEGGGEEERRGRIRRWVDRRLGDSFPVEVAERMVAVALQCVEEEAAKRPEMGWVVARVSKMLMDSEAWEKRVGVPVDFSVSLAPR